jgi:DNA-binding transcriptional LysR family regulator
MVSMALERTVMQPRRDWQMPMFCVSELRDKPAGTIRITAADYAIDHLLWPKLRKLLPNYPGIKVELMLDNGLSDIVTERYDTAFAWASRSPRT